MFLVCARICLGVHYGSLPFVCVRVRSCASNETRNKLRGANWVWRRTARGDSGDHSTGTSPGPSNFLLCKAVPVPPSVANRAHKPQPQVPPRASALSRSRVSCLTPAQLSLEPLTSWRPSPRCSPAYAARCPPLAPPPCAGRTRRRTARAGRTRTRPCPLPEGRGAS